MVTNVLYGRITINPQFVYGENGIVQDYITGSGGDNLIIYNFFKEYIDYFFLRGIRNFLVFTNFVCIMIFLTFCLILLIKNFHSFKFKVLIKSYIYTRLNNCNPLAVYKFILWV